MKSPIHSKIERFYRKISQLYAAIGVLRLIAFGLIIIEIILIFHDVYESAYKKGYEKGYSDGSQKAALDLKPKMQKLSQSLDMFEDLYDVASKNTLPVMEKPNLYIPELEGTLSYAHAIDIAQSYYDKESYKSAIVWAYRANQINPKDIKSWEIYTKSLEKIGTDEEITKAKYLMEQVKNYFGKKADEKGL